MEASFSTVKREIIIETTPERVWHALTIPEERNRWETRNCTIDLRVGGIIELDYGWGVSYTGTIQELAENSRLVIADQDGELTIWTLEPHHKGTLVGIEYTGFWAGDLGIMSMENMAYGTYRFMKNMKQVFEEGSDLRSSFWKSWIGVNHITYHEADTHGVKVVQISQGTPAEGILHIGDIITQANETMVRNYDEFEEIVTSMEPQVHLKITFIRNDQLCNADLCTVPFGQRH
ncbi:SRPBCC domain-containing protein [Paenibacillus dakarensis]|uniref:SRPBCC domain-containing protein n=1 Tax=Paenibacillus dakarensis TaxID=1527293 RepID=UPI0006D5723B|nr:SRPBCC domain-containing protein [Paenibacillus dakarensis]